MLRLLFPPKCVLCQQLLTSEETDLCHYCRTHTELLQRTKRKIPFVAQWTALWYYKDTVIRSIRRFKFSQKRHYGQVYARLLAISLTQWDADLISWVPVSPLRRLQRGYDQAEVLAKAVRRELGIPAVPVLKKIRHTPPQSGIRGIALRRANVLGAFRPIRPGRLSGKRILLLDDVITTGATASECARTLLVAGAKEVYFAAVAAAENYK